MQRDAHDIESALLKKGFLKADGDHHYFKYQTISGLITPIKTKTSHTPKQKSIGDSLLGKMCKQCHLSKSQFIELVDCPMTRKQYETILKNDGMSIE